MFQHLQLREQTNLKFREAYNLFREALQLCMAQAGRGLVPADPRPLKMFRRCPYWHMVWGPKFVAHAWFAAHVLIKARAS